MPGAVFRHFKMMSSELENVPAARHRKTPESHGPVTEPENRPIGDGHRRPHAIDRNSEPKSVTAGKLFVSALLPERPQPIRLRIVDPVMNTGRLCKRVDVFMNANPHWSLNMRMTKKFLSTLMTAALVSGTFAGTALAVDPDEFRGDRNGEKPLSVRQQQPANAKALADARSGNLLILPALGSHNGEYRATIGELAASRTAYSGTVTNAPRIAPAGPGDYNGTAKIGRVQN